LTRPCQVDCRAIGEVSLGPNGKTLYFLSNRSPPVKASRTRAELLADYVRMETWDRGDNAIWTLPMAPYLAQAATFAPVVDTEQKPATAAPQASLQPAPRRTLPEPVKAYFSGNWSGSGKFTSSGRPLESTLSFELAAGGEAILVKHAEKAPDKFAYSALLSIDTKNGSPVLLMAANNWPGL
jgi:hypothetical protein